MVLLEATERRRMILWRNSWRSKKSVASNSILISDLATRVDAKSEDTAAKSDKMDSQMSSFATENKRLRDKVDELDTYKRRWNLRNSGIPEADGENVKMVIMDIFLH